MQNTPRGAARSYFLHAGALLAVAAASGLLPPGYRLGYWVPLHIGLVGASVLGVAGAATFFLATLRRAPIPGTVVRIAHITLHHTAVLSLVGGRILGWRIVVMIAGIGVIVSLATIAVILAWQTVRSQAHRFGGQPAAYLVAIAMVLTGSVLGLLLAVGGAPRGSHAAHMALNLYGFLGVVALGTLPRFFPMIVRVRIQTGLAPDVPWIVTATGAVLWAAGSVVGSQAAALIGILLGLAGAALMAATLVQDLWASRAPIQGDAAHVTAAAGWYVAAWLVLAVSQGVAPAGLIPAVAVGFGLQIFIGAWSYFVPATQPGASSDRRVAREMLARGLVPRMVMINAAAALLLLAGPRWAAAGWVLAVAAMVWFGVRVVLLRKPAGHAATPPRT